MRCTYTLERFFEYRVCIVLGLVLHDCTEILTPPVSEIYWFLSDNSRIRRFIVGEQKVGRCCRELVILLLLLLGRSFDCE